jgi:hypothetical protein
MRALSFAVHIPIVCFGIAFPAFVLPLEGLWLRTGDPLYRTIAKRWSKVMLALFDLGVVTGTILRFELGSCGRVGTEASPRFPNPSQIPPAVGAPAIPGSKNPPKRGFQKADWGRCQGLAL